jgi:hypothetical protein
VRAAIGRAAYWRYGRRQISAQAEFILFGCGFFWSLVCGAGLVRYIDQADALTIGWSAFGLVLVAAGIAHRRIRKTREAGVEFALFSKRAKYRVHSNG